MEDSQIILPGHPFFDAYLYGTLPPDWRDFAFANPDFAFVVRADGSGLLEPVSPEDLEEYVEGGEYDNRLVEMGEYADNYG